MEISRYRMNGIRHVGRPIDTEAKPFLYLTARFGKIRPAHLCALVFCLSVLFFAATTRAQTTGAGSIQGIVTDPSGALIPNASVKLVETSTNVTLTTKTSSGGTYAFPNISVGTYTLTVTAAGFETFTSTGNVLEVGSSIAINAQMTVGSADVKVEIHAEGVALQTEDANFKQTVDSTEMTEMPLNGRTMTGLISLGRLGTSGPAALRTRYCSPGA